MKHSTLVLDADYTILDILDWKEAFTLIYAKDDCGGSNILATYDDTVKDSAGRVYNLPAVIVRRKYVGANNKRAPYSKNGAKLRDRYQCQYCGRTYSKEKLNIDHVIPQSKPQLLPKGIKMSSWENIVTTCVPCNSKKDNKTLKEVGFKLLRQPRPITKGERLLLTIQQRKYPSEWAPYIDSLST